MEATDGTMIVATWYGRYVERWHSDRRPSRLSTSWLCLRPLSGWTTFRVVSMKRCDALRRPRFF